MIGGAVQVLISWHWGVPSEEGRACPRLSVDAERRVEWDIQLAHRRTVLMNSLVDPD